MQVVRFLFQHIAFKECEFISYRSFTDLVMEMVKECQCLYLMLPFEIYHNLIYLTEQKLPFFLL